MGLELENDSPQLTSESDSEDETPQTVHAWPETESLEDFMDPNDPKKTVEGYPAPIRAMMTATTR